MPRFLRRSRSGELEQGSSKEAGVAGTGGRSNKVVKVREVSLVAMFGW